MGVGLGLPENSAFGIYRGYIEYINDPQQLGRVKVRVPSIHGYPKDVPTELLPWAYVMSPFGGGHDYGMKAIPPVGSACFITFEGGNKNIPLVLGMWDGIPDKDSLMLRNPVGTLPKRDISMSPSPSEPWAAPPGPDSPKEYLQQVDHRPERYVPFKSVKGAVLDIEDRDEVEHTELVDRAGQGLFLSGPIKDKKEKEEPANLNNEAQRGLKKALEGTQFPLESTVAEEAEVVIVDLGSQSISLNTSKGNNKIVISSKQSETTEDITQAGSMELPGKSNASLELCSGGKTILLSIQKEGKVVSKIYLNGETGAIEIEAPSLLRIKADNAIIEGNTLITGTLTVNKSITCLENGLFSGALSSI